MQHIPINSALENIGIRKFGGPVPVKSEFDVGLVQTLAFQKQEELVSQQKCYDTR